MKNTIQFQKGLSFPEFLRLYGLEEQCREAVFDFKWPNGFRCPDCGYDKYCEIKSRKCLQCNRCHHQTSLLVGTIFEQTNLPLTVWFLAIYLISQAKSAISTMSLFRKLGVSYNTAWHIKQKLMQVMLEDERKHPLSGDVQMDDAYWGGELTNDKRGRGSPNKTPFVAAVAMTDDNEKLKSVADFEHFLKIKLHKVTGFTKEELKRWAEQNLAPKSEVVTDGLKCFNGLDAAGFKHRAIVTGGGHQSVEIPEFLWVNTVLGNVKTAIHGTYHAIRSKHLPRYLAEFEYRFNHRFDLAALFKELVEAAVNTTPMPCKMLKLAEAYW